MQFFGAQDEQAKILCARFSDAIAFVRKTGAPKFVGFLDRFGQELFEKVCTHEKFAGAMLFGGFALAQRKMAGFFLEDGFSLQEKEQLFPASALTFHFREKDKLSHRDFLGSLMALGISREMLGDILVGDGRAVVFASWPADRMIREQVVKIGRVGVKISDGAENFEDLLPKTETLTGTVSTGRADAVVAFLTKLSREKAQKIIAGELVRVNDRTCTSVSAQVKEKDILAVRGYGKYEILSFDGTTKKGRERITAIHYV